MANHIHYHCLETVDAKSEIFSTLTSNEFGAVLTVQHGFHKHIILSNKNLKEEDLRLFKAQIENGHQPQGMYFYNIEK